MQPEMTALIESHLVKTITDVEVPGLGASYNGKVRRSYDDLQGRRIIIATDRLSAFDCQITTIPFKGQALTQASRYWFDTTTDICPNHAIAYPDPNVMICQKLDMLPVEMVVRGYLAGSTSTSILTMYKSGHRDMYGTKFPDGLRDNQQLPHPIITPTTKAGTGMHDAPLSAQDVVQQGLVSAATWEQLCSYALALFARGQSIARERGLILADTKYEFGLAPDGSIVLGDEVHTPDSSRYWILDTYEKRLAAAEPPDVLDKDIVRRWVVSQCDPYKDPLPSIPDALRVATAQVYMSLFERITNTTFVPPDSPLDPIARIQAAVTKWVQQA